MEIYSQASSDATRDALKASARVCADCEAGRVGPKVMG